MSKRIDYQRAGDIDRATRLPDERPQLFGLLVIVTGATAISSGTGGYRWLYNWSEAQLGAAPTYTAATRTNGFTGVGLSISELGNTTTTVAFGVTIANIPTGYAPVRIPNNTPVWAVPFNATDGTLIWLLLNTQAIDGTCP